VGTGKVAKAAILGQQGGVWATSPGYSVRAIYMLACPSCPSIHLSQLSVQEQKDIIAAHANPEKTQAGGLRLAGQKFFTLQAGERSIYLKKGV